MGFPKTIGCIDGCYIPIPLPKEHSEAYICRKNFPCIILQVCNTVTEDNKFNIFSLQAVCDHRLLFTHCYAGEVGSQHDAKVLKNSEVWTYMHEQTEEMFPDDTHILGDKAYPCLPKLITPYKENGHLTHQQRHFNYMLSSTRSTIERAFGLLKKRFRRLKYLDVRSLQWIPKYIIASCVLHNICILQEDIMELNIVLVEDLEDEAEIAEGAIAAVAERQLGHAKRNHLCNLLLP